MTKAMSKRTLDFITFIPFGVAISAFILYLRYSLPIILHEKIAVTGLILNYANRFRNIAIFSGIIGIVFLIITSPLLVLFLFISTISPNSFTFFP